MLKFLTHKLRTHSLNEENVSEKVEERDSGTESDDEADRGDTGDFCTDVIMKWNNVTDISMGGEACACAPAPRALPDPEPDQLYDHHSSEEELEVGDSDSEHVDEDHRLTRHLSLVGNQDHGQQSGRSFLLVINGAPCGATTESRRRGASSPPPAAPEKRKWPAQPYDADEPPRPPSSDDDDTKVETPVRFRTSPPLEALKPRRAGAGAGCACSPRAPGSPRRRRAALPPPRRHRPALDFDKMQQLKVGGVRSWRGVGSHAHAHAHGGELSVFCW